MNGDVALVVSSVYLFSIEMSKLQLFLLCYSQKIEFSSSRKQRIIDFVAAAGVLFSSELSMHVKNKRREIKFLLFGVPTNFIWLKIEKSEQQQQNGHAENERVS